ncbi:MAG: hypothetical protein KJO11_07640 [Gemmatimonadetes bacterium]|nr:hypothetical protein [Gemmatimonadota bacterium]MBT8403994.1 hypothetical protein [Gemmatimonadota bacterium]
MDRHRILALRRALPGLLLAGVVATTAPTAAQDVILDEGRFALFSQGREVGHESFSIHRVGMGQTARILATATVEFDGERMSPALAARSDFTVSSYENEVTGTRSADLSVVLADGRYVSRIRSPEGETQREYRAAQRTVVLENHVSHQYYFVARFVDDGGGPVVVLDPGADRPSRLSLVSQESEPFRLGGRQIQARHLRLDGSGTIRDLWIDDQGRVLRVEIPALGFRAERLPDPS